MELLQLTYFCSAAETENFSETAAMHNVPPSNISQTVSRLEKELGVTLFDRFANRISLNERGRKFYLSVKNALKLIDEAKISVNDDGEFKGEIRISVCVNRRVVTRSIEKFRSAYPQISFYINHNISSSDEVDIIVADDGFNGKHMKKELLLSEDIVLAVSEHNALYGKKKVISEDLINQRFITMPDDSSIFRYTQRICSDMGFTPEIAIQSDDPYYVRKYVELGLGIAFVPSVSWQGLFSENTTFIKVGKYKRNTYVFWNEDKYMSRGVETFLKELISECKSF